MKCYAIVRNGKCSQVVCCDPHMAPLVEDGAELHEVDSLFDASDLYYDGKAVKRKPPMPHSACAWNDEIQTWVASDALKWNEVRAIRETRLQASDWTQLPDVPLATKEAWAVYRQALRDITNQPDPFNITWPTPPQ